MAGSSPRLPFVAWLPLAGIGLAPPVGPWLDRLAAAILYWRDRRGAQA